MRPFAPGRRGARLGLAAVVSLSAAAGVSFGSAPIGHATSAVGFAAPVFVDTVRAGGEPGIIHSSKFGTLVYSAHEGTTHLDRNGAASESTFQFLCPSLTTADCYKNHVWIWTSDDGGTTWTLRDEGLPYTGFSDPDLTEDSGGAIYDTGIDLANDAVFASLDGGKTWTHGTVQCHEGDRPWLAGGVAGEVFMATDDQMPGTGHTLFHSTDHADSCGSTGIPDFGSWANGGSYSGFGKGVYDPHDGSFIEPAQFADGNGHVMRVGISRLPNAADAFKGGGETFQPLDVADTPGVYSPFGAPEVISMDSAENIYFAWDTDERDTSGSGCGPQADPGRALPNRIMLEVGRHTGPGQWQFQPPISLAHQGNARVLWPWSAAGSAGNVSVVWYQMDRMADPDCDMNGTTAVPDVNTSIYEAHISNATDPATRSITVTDASGRAIHQGGICDSGTTCVATGQDRRLGDYFTNSVDANGCVVIASGDTTTLDPVSHDQRITSLPVFIRQDSGPSLTGRDCGATAASGGTPAATPASSVAGATSSPAPGAPPGTALPNTSAGGSGGITPAGPLGSAVAAILGAIVMRRRRGRA